ncbi:MAG TPA: hypothetical protein VKI62_05845, partial [Bacteroidota bacterium]|nr:hypothetical protein [Bacteroidota bacterium]
DENDQTPKSAFERLGGEWFRKRWNEYWDITTGKKGGGNIWFDDASGLYRVVEWHDKRQETHKFIYSPVADPETGEQPFEEIPKEFHDDKEYVDQVKNTTVPVQTPEGIQTGERPKYPAAMEHEERVTKIWLTVICPTLLPDDLIMEIEHPVQDAGFQYKDIACYDWHPDPLETISVMDTIKAPTDLFIHQLIASMTLINKAVAPPYLFPKGMIVGEQMQAFKSQAGGEMKEYTQIAGYSKPEQEETPVKLVQFLSGLGDEARSLVEYLGGISPSGKGYKDSGKEGAALFQAKIRQNEVMTYYLFKNISEATRECWVYMSQLLRVYLKTPRELQILADTDNPETLVVNAGIINGQNTNVEDEKYDFIPDIQSIGESARQEKVVSLGQILPMAMNFDPMAGGWVLAKILKYMDIPEGSEGAKLIEQLIGQRQQMQQQQMAMAEGHQKLDLLSKAKELVSKPKQKQIPQRSAA